MFTSLSLIHLSLNFEPHLGVAILSDTPSRGSDNAKFSVWVIVFFVSSGNPKVNT